MFVLHMNLNALFPPFSPPRDSNSAEVTTRCRRTASKTCSKVRSTTWRSRCCPEWTASRRGSPGCATRRSSVGEWSPPSRLSTRGSPTWRKVAKWKEEITQGGRSRIFFFFFPCGDIRSQWGRGMGEKKTLFCAHPIWHRKPLWPRFNVLLILSKLEQPAAQGSFLL